MRRISVLAGVVVLCGGVSAAQPVDFSTRTFKAALASLTEDGFVLERSLGTANFAPELRLPVQLTYRSASETSGAFGFAWSSPQLESSAAWDKDGVLWTSPWGEKIKFFPKKEKTRRDGVKVPLYEEAKKGRGFYAPYSDWEANLSKGNDTAAGDWVFSGKRDLAGWRFVYRGGRLATVTALSGRTLEFVYDRDNLVAVSQDGQKLVTAEWSGGQISALTVGGVTTRFTYETAPVKIFPKTTDGQILPAARPRLAAMTRGDLEPEKYTYEGNWLAGTRQGDSAETFTVQTVTLHEHFQNLRSRQPKSKVKHTGKIGGRILSDNFHTYSYGEKTGNVTLKNKKGETSTFSFDIATGVFALTDFGGRKNTIYYHMRHDAAYLGKVRKIVDGKGRDVLSVRYDKMTGKPTRIRDRLGNDRLFEHETGRCRESRRASDAFFSAPVCTTELDAAGRTVSQSVLDKDGNAVVTTTVQRDAEGRPVRVSDGRQTVTVTYTKAGLPETVTDTFGRTTRLAYDAWNRVVAQTDAEGLTTRLTFSPAGLVTRLERVDGKEVTAFTEISYDGCGRPSAVRDQRGRRRACDRDAFGRIVKEYWPNGTEVGYEYNARGQLAKVLDENGHPIAFDWGALGLASRTTAADQLTRYVRDNDGLLQAVLSEKDGKTDRAIRITRDKHDRPVRVTYAKDEVVTVSYDVWGRVETRTRGAKKETYEYDGFGRLVKKDEDGVVTTYTYNAYGQRTRCETKNGRGETLFSERRTYDAYGRLTEIRSGGQTVGYDYDKKGRVAHQRLNGKLVTHLWTKHGQLQEKIFGDPAHPEGTLRYLYAKDGELEGRIVNGETQKYVTDGRGQLLAVLDAAGRTLESYTYDPAGNILKKTVNGKTTTFTYDAANQLTSSTTDGKTTKYVYDAAGRMVKEGTKTYRYGWLDKVVSVRDGKRSVAFDYHVDGQLASRREGTTAEDFLWDGLALVKRGARSFVNEPHPGGGNPVLSSDGAALFNDALGTTLGAARNGSYEPTPSTAFGETPPRTGAAPPELFFTGKPFVADLGHAFLFRNYRATLGKWQTADPLGYPDGWNQLAYCNNGGIKEFDLFGGHIVQSSITLYTYTSTYFGNVPMDYNFMCFLTGDCNDNFNAPYISFRTFSGTGINGSIPSVTSIMVNDIIKSPHTGFTYDSGARLTLTCTKISGTEKHWVKDEFYFNKRVYLSVGYQCIITISGTRLGDNLNVTETFAVYNGTLTVNCLVRKSE